MQERPTSKREITSFVVVIAVLVLLKEHLCTISSMDEIRNYNLSRAIAMGLIPYRDFNMVMTPFFFQVFAIPLMLSRTLFMCRLSYSLYLVFTEWVFYRIVKEKCGHKVALFLCLCSIPFLDIATYNTMFFVFAMHSYDLLRKKAGIRTDILLGVVTTLAALSRQTSGSLFLILCFILILRSSEKSERIKNAFWFIVGMGGICVAFLIYLLATGSFGAFWDHCFFAIFKTDGNSAIAMSGIPGLLFVLTGSIIDILNFRKTKDKDQLFHLLIGLTIFTIGVPIVDQMHMVYAGMWFAFPVVKFIVDRISNKLTSNIWLILDIGAIALSLVFTFLSFRGSVFVNDIEELRYIPLPPDIKAYQDISEINKLYEEQGYEVTVFAKESALISIVGGEFHAPYDLFLKGNLGLTDPMSYAEEACSKENSIILVTEGYNESDWEAPEGIEEYITTHCHPIYSYSQYVWYMPDQ